ncbi:hypothetical protein B296_00055141 [Ensete ventricosum]|uniref:Uncharacterized protein n=1 Tax=Ensete ventricosum TaxID=4639 RepID=A0A426WWL2_ENSVE|nr:hypothetical protein B296_00055141 [Ensete ventricosum]
MAAAQTMVLHAAGGRLVHVRPLLRQVCCPSGWTGTAAPRAVALTGAVPAGASLVGWRCPRRGRLLVDASMEPPLQEPSMPTGDCTCWQFPMRAVTPAGPAACGHPYGAPGNGRSPLQGFWPWLAILAKTQQERIE